MLSAFFSLKCAALAPFIGARWKHSNTQLKRLFKNNPARKRIEARQGIDHSPLPLDPPKYDAIFQPNFLPNGWCAPAPAELVPTYPFAVGRTKNKPNDAVGFLPVYTKYRWVQYQVPGTGIIFWLQTLTCTPLVSAKMERKLSLESSESLEIGRLSWQSWDQFWTFQYPRMKEMTLFESKLEVLLRLTETEWGMLRNGLVD